jgi:hypothetical protein
MDEKPEALLLAECLEQHEYCTFGQMGRAAAELRRLHEVNEQLLEALQWIEQFTAPFIGVHDAGSEFRQWVERARAAIAKAEGK